MGREQSLGYHTKDTGFLPATDQRVIDVREISAYRWQWKLMSDIDWNYRNRGTTRDAALLAARCAVLGVEAWDSFSLCAAIDAKETR